MDKLTINRIQEFHPKHRFKLTQDYIAVNEMLGSGIRLRFSCVYRTPEEQDILYKKKPMVTNAKAWESMHQYAFAFDVVILWDKDGNGTFETVSYDMLKDLDKDGKADWREIIDGFIARGYEWSGGWKGFKESAHFQIKDLPNHKVLKALIDSNRYTTEKKNGKMIKYVDL